MGAIQHNEVMLALPSGWEDGSQVIALGPVDGSFRPNLVVSREAARSETAEQFAKRQLPSLRSALKGLAVVAEGPASFGSNKGFLRQHTFTAQGAKLGQLQFYVLHGQFAYTLTFTHLANKLAGTRKLAEQLLGSVKVG